MTKITHGLDTAKIDSLTLKIRQEKCAVNNSDIGEIMNYSRKDTGEWKGEKTIWTQYFEIEGVQTKIQLCTEINGIEQATPVWRINANAKQLGTDKYNEGLTLNNIEYLFDKIQKTTGIHFQPDALINARFEDVDICYDQEQSIEQWHRYNQDTIEQITAENWEKYGLKYTAKSSSRPVMRKLKPGELITGIQLNERTKKGKRIVNVTHPHIKHYRSAEDKKARIAKGEKSLIGYEPGDRNRIETQIQNPYWNTEILNKVPKPLLFQQLLEIQHNQNAVLTDYIRGIAVRQYGNAQNEVTTTKKRKMSDETPTQFAVRELFIRQKINRQMPHRHQKTEEQIIADIVAEAKTAYDDRGKIHDVKKFLTENWQVVKPLDPKQTDLQI